ncbi:protein arginine methyltransferase NDUFAF7, mitochondrial [Acyrthosiphon pisum]|uniref:Protein arginine methyltransferase NDUFAF7 n=1 Tax=Acyrthosiphon pisum TaxID=7029 RepID=A0A8R2F9U4_ACYPI|nr:protein arginine methyltransferase NDUFAF7, mitochondrial [Acyrthosiphon pisum]|eukprot:XP_008185383.2 PREDICTED: NADH dehydrogenase [ubiquinone] complex I, assembly factor 7 [Acyrthosiphon pisum]
MLKLLKLQPRSIVRTIATLQNNLPVQQNLTKYFQDKIRINGPITLAEYMRESLKTYYNSGNVFGSDGDFITSPEISQLYGEMVMLWLLSLWEKAGCPSPVNLIELGPGTGVMMTDMLRLLKQTQYSSLDLSIHMVETSKKCSLEQADKLGCSDLRTDSGKCYYQHGITSEKYGMKEIFWYESIDDIPRNTFSLIVAQEFFDALPVHKFRKINEKWREIVIDIENDISGTFRYVLSKTSTTTSNLISTIDYYKCSNLKNVNEIEVGLDAAIVMQKLSERIILDGGIFLCIDYGQDKPIIDTFRAFSGHQQVNPLHKPGTVDLTADVDFNRLKNVAGTDVLAFGPIGQNIFLENMMINLRYQNLLTLTKNEKEATSLTFGYNKLMEMGKKFKIMGMVPATMAPLLNDFPVSGFGLYNSTKKIE